MDRQKKPPFVLWRVSGRYLSGLEIYAGCPGHMARLISSLILWEVLCLRPVRREMC